MLNYQEQYIQMLRIEFSNRRSGNQSYSLRAFARDLNIEAPRLSMIFNKKKGISVLKASELISKLSWNSEDKELFVHLVQAAHARSLKERLLAQSKVTSRTKKSLSSIEKFVEDDYFKQIAEPIHFLIIEALKLSDVEPTIEGLNRVIDYPHNEIADAVARLISLKLLEERGKKLKVKEYIINSGGKTPSMALRKHHSMQLRSAINAINSQDVNTRILSSLTIAVPQELVPEISEMIASFRRDVNTYILNHKNQNKTDVYCLSTQFFKLTQ